MYELKPYLLFALGLAGLNFASANPVGKVSSLILVGAAVYIVYLRHQYRAKKL